MNASFDIFDDFCSGSEFWNTSLLINNYWPEFTPCFRYTALVWGPCGWLWITAPVNIYYLVKHRLQESPETSVLNITKIFLCLILTIFAIMEAVVGRQDDLYHNPVSPALYVSCGINAITFIFAAILTALSRRAGLTSPCILFIFWFLTLVGHVIPLYTLIIQQEGDNTFVRLALFCGDFGLILLQFVLHCISEPQAGHRLPENQLNPGLQASFLSKVTFHWVSNFIYKGYIKPLRPDDIFALPPDCKAANIMPEFNRRWTQEVSKSGFVGCYRRHRAISENRRVNKFTEKTRLIGTKKIRQKNSIGSKRTPSLIRVLFRNFYLEMFCANLMRLVADSLLFVNPILLQALIAFIQTKKSSYAWQGWVIVFAFFVVTFFYSILYNQNSYRSYNISMKIKSALVTAVYRKSLTTNNEARRKFTSGYVVNLIAIDCQRVQDVAVNLCILLSAPLQIIIAFYFLNNTLGVSFVAGVLVLVAMIPINIWISALTRRTQSQQFAIKDERIKLMNDILNGIKLLKMYAWEEWFEEKVNTLREREVKFLKTFAMLNTVNNFFWICSPVLVTLATFITYVQIHDNHILEPSVAFVSLSLLNILRQPLNLLPTFISDIVQALVSICRIRDFLAGEEINFLEVKHNSFAENAIEMERATFTWNRHDTPNLRNISLRIPCGHLVAVVGSVGAGKSSLLAAMLGEMEKINGNITIKGNIAYVSQEPWIQNKSVRDNIIFGNPVNERWYRRVIRTCALQQDIDNIAGEDDTSEIGAKAVNISGGQKQQLSLARAVYQCADIYLLDDPLASIDIHVSKHIFKKVFSSAGVLKDKTRIFVTHAVHWLPSCDYVIVMDRGFVTQFGTYEDLMSRDGPLAQFLRTYLLREDDVEFQDPEIQKIRCQMLEKVEYVMSDGLTSADEEEFLKRRQAMLKTRLDETLSPEQPSSTSEEEDDSQRIQETGVVLVTDEKSEEGKIKTRVLVDFIRAFGLWSSLGVIMTMILYQGLGIVASIWLSTWTEDPYLRNETLAGSAEYTSKTFTYLAIFSVFGILQAVATFVFVAHISLRMVVASKKLHTDMLFSIMRQPMSFFDTTPLGRVMNRFSRDIDVIDGQMAKLVLIFVQQLFTVLSVLIVISYTTPIFLTVAFPILLAYSLVQKFYMSTSRQLRRNESTSRSPIYAHVSETINGASCIRAFGVSERFIDELACRVDRNNAYYYAFTCASRWLRVRLELLGNFVVLFSAVFALTADNMSGSLVGLSVSYALQVTASLNMLVQNSTLLESNVISVERIMEYSNLPQEPAWIEPEKRPARGWPCLGDVTFSNFSACYREGLNLVLKNVTCMIKGGEKVGIVGRTGAGKTSLSMALFRMIEATSGNLFIDGVDISDIGLHDLRKCLTILPQDPILFSGSLRFNIDPFNQFNDDEIWVILETAHLKEFVKGLSDGLEYNCGEGGHNLSVGQRQLVCLARSLLKGSRILVMDEATASVDLETDELIQKTIRTAFKDSTVLTIAHRINTIIDYDKIIVMDAGRIVEFDTPDNLLKNTQSIFHTMAKEANIVHIFDQEPEQTQLQVTSVEPE